MDNTLHQDKVIMTVSWRGWKKKCPSRYPAPAQSCLGRNSGSEPHCVWVDCTQVLSSLVHSNWETGASERPRGHLPCSAPVSRAVAHLARSSLSITEWKERDCVHSSVWVDLEMTILCCCTTPTWFPGDKRAWERGWRNHCNLAPSCWPLLPLLTGPPCPPAP